MADKINPSLADLLNGTRADPRSAAALAILSDVPFIYKTAPSAKALVEDVNAINDPDELIGLVSQLKIAQVTGDVKALSGGYGVLKGALKGVERIPGTAGYKEPAIYKLTYEDGRTEFVQDGGMPELVLETREPNGEVTRPAEGRSVDEVSSELFRPGVEVPAIPERQVPQGRLGHRIGIALVAGGVAITEQASRQLQDIENRLAADVVLRTKVADRLNQILGRGSSQVDAVNGIMRVGDVSLSASLGLVSSSGGAATPAVKIGPPMKIVTRQPNQVLDPPVDRVASPVRLATRRRA